MRKERLMPDSGYAYVGRELHVFEHATNWKRYFAANVRPYLGTSVIEVGAGIGANIGYLYDGQPNWLCVEPDPQLADVIRGRIQRGELPATCRVFVGTIGDLPACERATSVLYIDVLEHIEDDAREIAIAARRLEAGGHLIALSPAHQWLFSPFDSAIGHHRRYATASCRKLTVPELRLVALRYLDSVGMLASAANKLLLRASTPTKEQILLWDQFMVPVSRWLDPVIKYCLGKSILSIWQRRN
jgi:SAM-dependent methyltransferase